MKSLGLLAVFLFLFFVGSIYAYDFEKCTPSVAYWYNYYYDPEALAKMMPDSTGKDSSEQKDTTAEIFAPIDSAVVPGDTTESVPDQTEKAMDELPTEPDQFPTLTEPLIIDPTAISHRNGAPYIHVLIKYTGDISEIQALGVVIGSRGIESLPAAVPLEVLPQLDALENVQYIDLQPTIKINAIEESLLDISIPDIGADSFYHIPYQIYDGKDVVVGLIDLGIDYWNMDFRNPDSTSRIAFLWDQALSGNPPTDIPFTYGSEWSAAQIDSALFGWGVSINSFDSSGHGTHVAGICCGNGQETGNSYPTGRYKGVAPECDIIVVESNLKHDGLYDAVKYIAKRAALLNKPWTLSLNMSFPLYGARNGTSHFEKFLDSIVTDYSAYPESIYGTGRAIVVPAGNDGTEIGNPWHSDRKMTHTSGIGHGTVELNVICDTATVVPAL